MSLVLARNATHSNVLAIKNSVITAVTIPANTKGAWVSNLSAILAGAVTLDLNPNHTKGARVGTFNGVGLEDETITVGTTVYTLKEEVSDTAYEVLIGATADDTADNLAAAINRTLPLTGLFGAETPEHPDVKAAAVAADVTVTAKVGGTPGNSIATTTTSAADFSWAGATLTGGANDDTGFGIILPWQTPILVEWDPDQPPVGGLFNTVVATDVPVRFVWIPTFVASAPY